MYTFNIEGPQWILLLPIYSYFEIGFGVLCLFLSILVMHWFLFRYYFKKEVDKKDIEYSFDTVLINTSGMFLTYLHSWWK
jgi:hypothetical protein